MERRFGNVERINVLAEATVLDPRFKKHAFVNERYTQDALSRVVAATSQASSSSVQSTTSEERGSAEAESSQSETVPLVWADFEERVTRLRPGVQNPLTEAMLEVKGFTSEQLIPRTADPLEWWRIRSLVYKNMCTVRKTKLCIVATSVPSERIFSKTGQIISDRRSSLRSSKVQELAFLNANL